MKWIKKFNSNESLKDTITTIGKKLIGVDIKSMLPSLMNSKITILKSSDGKYDYDVYLKSDNRYLGSFKETPDKNLYKVGEEEFVSIKRDKFEPGNVNSSKMDAHFVLDLEEAARKNLNEKIKTWNKFNG